MSNKFQQSIIIAFGFILIWLLIDRESKKKEIEELTLKVDENENLNESIKQQLQELIHQNNDLGQDIKNELAQIIGLINIQQQEGAVMKLTKIIENLLKKLYKDDEKFRTWYKNQPGKNAVFADYIEFAKLDNQISKEDYHIVKLMKDIRNQEAHELDIKKHPSKILVSFFSGVSIIITLTALIAKRLRAFADNEKSKGAKNIVSEAL
ncbi:hypothetical protein WG904_19055 [Pedobacter sp. Du54]|uniref:hypothetical protein n=1 Tax=Pedobacter anseongensis TaxID=3133439 RepID=UPI0030A88C9B